MDGSTLQRYLHVVSSDINVAQDIQVPIKKSNLLARNGDAVEVL
jgi:hypothetical protein